jgi:glycerophosphoryl diester phosphodiesterase
MRIYGHRGLNDSAPENSMAAFDKAIQEGADGIEFDVQLSKDGEVVVIHDFTVNRTTDGQGAVSEKSLAELKALNLLDDKGRTLKVPTLKEIFEAYQENVLLNIELKNPSRFTNDICEKVVQLVDEFELQDRVLISSFDHRLLKRVSDLNPNIRLGVLMYSYLLNPIDYIENLGFVPHSIHPATEFVDEDFIALLRNHGHKVYVYTVNDPDDMAYLSQIGVDGIITDRPSQMQ